MSKWIISSHKFHKHKTFEAAQKEAERLSSIEGKNFNIYQIEETTEILPEMSEDKQASLVQQIHHP
jgi:hypothetical protein